MPFRFVSYRLQVLVNTIHKYIHHHQPGLIAAYPEPGCIQSDSFMPTKKYAPRELILRVLFIVGPVDRKTFFELNKTCVFVDFFASLVTAKSLQVDRQDLRHLSNRKDRGWRTRPGNLNIRVQTHYELKAWHRLLTIILKVCSVIQPNAWTDPRADQKTHKPADCKNEKITSHTSSCLFSTTVLRRR